MREPLIELEGVTKSFGGRSVLNQLAFHVNRGEILGLVGPNGSGKTTTVRLINGVMRPDAGRIQVNGYDPLHDGDAIRRMSGILTESASFYLNQTALANLRFFADLYGVTDRERPLSLLAEFGLAEHANQKVGQFSTGMKKRLGLAKALLHRPEILFLDEPTNGLDPEGMRQVAEAIVRLNRRDGTTILLCSHLLQQLERVCHRYLFIDNGRAIEEGTLAELESRYLTAITLVAETDLSLVGDSYRGVPARLVGPGRIEFRLKGKAEVPALLRQLAQDAALYEAQIQGQDLESIYFKLKEVAGRE